MNINEFTASFKRKPPTQEIEAEGGERWISWDEWQYRAVHEFLDSVAKKRGKRPKKEHWETYLAAHLEQAMQANLDRDGGLEDDSSWTDCSGSGSTPHSASEGN